MQFFVVALVFGASSFSFHTQSKTKYVHGLIAQNFEFITIHTQITVYKGTELILNENHAGVVTDLGDNMTLYKLLGDSDHQYGSLNSSAYTPFISIGNDTGTLSASSTVLPNEWHRELATVDAETQSSLNFSCVISGADIPAGTQTADCIGVCLTNSDDANDLHAYDTYTQITGIDSTFTINVDIQYQDSHTA